MFRTIALVIGWLPAIVGVVSAIEQIFGDAKGSEKKSAAMKALRQVLERANVPRLDNVMGIMSSVIDAVVGVLNVLGVAGFSDTADEEQEVIELIPAGHEVTSEATYEGPRAAYAKLEPRLEELTAQMKAAQ